MTEAIATQKLELCRLIERHTGRDGAHETAVPALQFIRYSQASEPAYRVYNPCFCFITQGVKEIMLAQEHFVYTSSDFLVASMNLPVVGQVIKASPEVPYLSFKMEFTQNQILEVLHESQLQILPGRMPGVPYSSDTSTRICWMRFSVWRGYSILPKTSRSLPLYILRKFCINCCRDHME